MLLAQINGTHKMNITATNKASGETIDLKADNFEEIVEAYRTAQEYEKVAKSLKDQLKKIVPVFLDEQGRSEVSKDGYQFKQYETQRQTYDKQFLRDTFDEDTLDLFMTVSKSKVESYVKLHPEEVTINDLKVGLVPDGAVSKTTRLDRVL